MIYLDNNATTRPAREVIEAMRPWLEEAYGNPSAGYRFGREAARWVRSTNVRLGVVNLLDRDPPLTSGALGYSPSVHGTMFPGRTWTLELSRRF